MTNNQMILTALEEYEENHYMSEDRKWQNKINKLIDNYSHKVIREEDKKNERQRTN